MDVRVLRLPEVLQRVRLSRSLVYSLMAEGSFPRPIKLGRRAVAWRAADIEAWLTSREAA
jgi:prophage regulatory protein